MNKIFVVCLFVLIGLSQIHAQTAPTPTPARTLEEEKARADRAEARIREWAQLSRYAEANAKIQPLTKDEKRVVFMGDSITDFWKLNEYFPNQPYINRGISGQQTPHMLIRFRPDVINLRPKVVIILAGTNDISNGVSLEIIEGNLTSMVELAHANGINVVLASVHPISDYNKNKDGNPIIRSTTRPPEKIVALNQWIKNYATQNGLVYLDYYSATVDDKGFLRADLADDGLHPNAKGYELMKPLVEKAIAEALKKKQKSK